MLTVPNKICDQLCEWCPVLSLVIYLRNKRSIVPCVTLVHVTLMEWGRLGACIVIRWSRLNFVGEHGRIVIHHCSYFFIVIDFRKTKVTDPECWDEGHPLLHCCNCHIACIRAVLVAGSIVAASSVGSGKVSTVLLLPVAVD